MKSFTAYLLVAAALYIIAPWGLMIIPDPVFGWGIHAACLQFSWIIAPLVVGSIGISIEYARIPIDLSVVRAELSEYIGPDAEAYIRGFERFIFACGIGHVLRPIALFAPLATIPLVIVDLWTLYVSGEARQSIKSATAGLRQLARDRDESRADASKAKLELDNIVSRIEARASSVGEALREVEHASATRAALMSLLSSSAEPVVLFDLDRLTITCASSGFWSMLDRDPSEGEPFLPMIHPDHREGARIASEDRPLSGSNPPPFDITYLSGCGRPVKLRFFAGYVPGKGEAPVAWFRVKGVDDVE